MVEDISRPLLIDMLALPEREGQSTYDVYRSRSQVVALGLSRQIHACKRMRNIR